MKNTNRKKKKQDINIKSTQRFRKIPKIGGQREKRKEKEREREKRKRKIPRREEEEEEEEEARTSASKALKDLERFQKLAAKYPSAISFETLTLNENCSIFSFLLSFSRFSCF